MSDSDSELETRLLDSPKEVATSIRVLNEEGLRRKISELDYSIQLGMKEVPFIETLAVVDYKGSSEKVDYKDATARESYFHSTTLRNVVKGCQQLREIQVQWNRPDDMLAEMLKSDQQMKKIKRDLLTQQEKIKAVELKKRRSVEKKFTKKIQVEKKKLKKQETKKNLREIENWKRGDHKGSASIEESFDKYFQSKDRAKTRSKSKNRQSRKKT
ncbi:putative EBNA1 binding protein 2 [Cryptosporidium felis]|nr:putative EBNA1 binding protein 2 [Cryptosporidium felis]